MSHIDRATRFRVLRDADFTCAYCGRRPPEVTLEVDHMVPRAKGGSNRRLNLVAACFDCNRGKRIESVDAVAMPVPKRARGSSPTVAHPDCCPTCWLESDGDDWSIAYHAVTEWRAERGYVASYRCIHGHRWQTGYDDVMRVPAGSDRIVVAPL